eukprot:335390-Prymnesium_polylepis.1
MPRDMLPDPHRRRHEQEATSQAKCPGPRAFARELKVSPAVKHISGPKPEGEPEKKCIPESVVPDGRRTSPTHQRSIMKRGPDKIPQYCSSAVGGLDSVDTAIPTHHSLQVVVDWGPVPRVLGRLPARAGDREFRQ